MVERDPDIVPGWLTRHIDVAPWFQSVEESIAVVAGMIPVETRGTAARFADPHWRESRSA
jgi:hypothetical protein